MALLKSNNITAGSPAHDFKLFDVLSKQELRLADYQDQDAFVIIFMCNHCPYVKHIISEFVSIMKQFPKAQCFAINSNDVISYPDDSPENMEIFAKQHEMHFPYLFDEEQLVADAYEAVCTPDIYIYDKNKKLAYHGRFDNSSPGNSNPVTGSEFKAALTEIIQGEEVKQLQIPSVGCSIKWY